MTSKFGVPPSVFMGQDRADVPAAAGRYMRTLCQHIDNGLCWNCDSRMAAGLERPVADNPAEFEDAPEDVPADLVEQIRDVPVAKYDCQRCGAEFTGGLRMMFLFHPAVVAFFYDRGVEIQKLPIWRYASFHPERERTSNPDPLRASVTYERDGDSLTLVVDEDLAVVDVQSP